MKEPKSKRAARIKRLVLGILLGMAAGYGCTFLPPQYQEICKGGVKLLGLLTSGG